MQLCLKVPREYDIVLISEKLGYAVSKGCPLELLPHCVGMQKEPLGILPGGSFLSADAG